METQDKPLPHWTWGDLEAVLDGFSPTGSDNPLRAYLMQGLIEDAERASPRELLKQVLSAGWVMAQMGTREDTSGTALRREAGAFGS